MPNEMEKLLNLQAVDHQLTESAEKVKRLRRDRERLLEKIEEEEEHLEHRADGLKQTEHESRMLNLQVDELDDKIRAYQHRLDTGIISFKEMEDLRAKILSERARISRMEDDALQRIESVEQEHVAMKEASDKLQQRREELEVAIDGVDRAMEEEGQITGALQRERSDVAAGLSEFALAQYASLRRKFPDVVVPIDHGTCSGCKLKLSGSTIERIRGGSGIIACEHCSRILHA